MGHLGSRPPPGPERGSNLAITASQSVDGGERVRNGASMRLDQRE